MFVFSGILTGVTVVAIWTKGFAAVEDETSVENGATNMGKFLIPIFKVFIYYLSIQMP